MLDSTKDFWNSLSKILLRCWIIGFALLLFSAGVFLLTGDMIDQIHGKLFGLTAHELDLILYCGLGLLKAGILLLFFIPWLSIRMVLKSERA